MAEKFSLKWNDFQTTLTSSFKDLRSGKDEDLFDVTLHFGKPMELKKT